jgi:chemotaxis protein MotB
MADPQKPAIIVRRKKRGGHGGGHHGGAWKVAYADFVTAMMSFFLLMWLLNVTTSDQRKGLADYFAPASISKSESGAGGVMGGQTINAAGVQISDSSPPTMDDRIIPTTGKGEEGEEDVRGSSDKAGGANTEQTPSAGESPTPPNEQDLAQAMQREEQLFKEAEGTLKHAIESAPGLQELAQQMIIDRTPEGLRIQIVDRDKFSMFPSGGAVPYERGRDLLRLVGKVISRLPNKVSVTGHTDSTPFPAGSRRDNWTLSSERANVSLDELVTGGVDEKRIARVVGMADRDPLVAGNPKDARNRRISIVLLRQTLPPPDAPQPSSPPSLSSPPPQPASP